MKMQKGMRKLLLSELLPSIEELLREEGHSLPRRQLDI